MNDTHSPHLVNLSPERVNQVYAARDDAIRLVANLSTENAELKTFRDEVMPLLDVLADNTFADINQLIDMARILNPRYEDNPLRAEAERRMAEYQSLAEEIDE